MTFRIYCIFNFILKCNLIIPIILSDVIWELFGNPCFSYVLKEGLSSLFNNGITQDYNLLVHLILTLLSVIQKLSPTLSITRLSWEESVFPEGSSGQCLECFISVPFISVTTSYNLPSLLVCLLMKMSKHLFTG